MQSFFVPRALCALLLLVAMVPSAQGQTIHNVTQNTYPATLADAVSTANPYDSIQLTDGTYPITSTLYVNKPLTIEGQTEAGVVIQVDTGSSWGFALVADDITLRGMTLEAVSTTADQGFPIHASGPVNPPNGFFNLTIEDLTVRGDATTTPKRRAGVDIHGFTNVVLDNVHSEGATFGNGIQLTGCSDVVMTNCSTSGNAWGSIAVYVSGATYLNRGSANVVIDGTTLSAAEGVIFQQDTALLQSTNVSVTGYEYNVFNPIFRAEAPYYTFFLDTLTDATNSALAFGAFATASSIQRVADGHFVVPAGLTIQSAVDAASAGGTVEVLAGTFQERVEIAKDLALTGAGAGVTVIESPVSVPVAYTSGSLNNRPVVYVHDAADVHISGLTVDGADRGNGNYRFYGIVYRNAGGSVSDCDVLRVRDLPNPNISGNQHGNAIYLYNNDTVARAFTVQGCNVADFQKNGITAVSLDGTALLVDISGNTVTGSGVLSADFGEPAQNGVQIYGELITGAVANNTVSGIAYDNTNAATKWVATTMLDYFSGVDFLDNLIPDSQVAIYKYDGHGVISGNDITVNKVGVYAWGIIGTDPPQALPQPYTEDEVAPKAVLAKSTVLNVVIDGNSVVFSGPDNTATYGIEVDAGYGPNDLAAAITNNTVAGFEAGVDVWQCQSGCDTGVFTSVSVNQNDLAGNTNGVRSNVTYLTVDASCNWFGDVSGPAEALLNPAGTGSAVEGDVLFQPWLDAPGGACLLSTDYAAVGPAPSEIGSCTPCIQVPVTLTRLDTSTARGVSVTFQLSPELELCGTPTLATGAGSFYDGFGPMQSYVLDNGGKNYTFDVSILGGACGPTGGGVLFNIPVTKDASVTTDTTGEITIDAVTFRDCANAPLPLFPGPGTTIDIDVTAPGAATNLVASQVRTGNDGSGRTLIDLTWDLPADLDLTAVKVYRKGFGFYPEYDDLGGSVPTAPATVAAALGAGWTLAATLPANAITYSDQPPVRDFWYYVVFVEDECDDSPVSNITGGTLNYHLGDIAPAPTGNNLVFTGDISALGAAYGTLDGNPNYNAAADVGPTTDFSVTARPTTDNRIQFEDLIVFAINYNSVSKVPAVPVASHNAVELVEPAQLIAGEFVSVPVRMSGNGALQGVSVQVAWNDGVLEYTGWSAGDLMNAQGRTAPVFSPQAGVIDAAVMGVGDQGISGEGVLATLQFRVKAEGPADLRFAEIDARDAQNQKVTLDGTVVAGAPSAPAVISRSTLRTNVPNPFNPSTKVRFAVAVAGEVSVRIYDVSGRLVRTLVSGEITAGEHEIVWNGTDDEGRGVASGTYLMRMSAPDASDSRRVVLLK